MAGLMVSDRDRPMRDRPEHVRTRRDRPNVNYCDMKIIHKNYGRNRKLNTAVSTSCWR